MSNIDDLKKQAGELGITVDGRWSEARVQEEIDKILQQPAANTAPPEVVGTTTGPSPTIITETVKPKASERKVDVLLKVDYWPEEDKRSVAGSTISLPVSKARELVGLGKAELSISNFGDDE